ncbi:hypothetical protein GF352_01950 [archaeon]|nr:hypothetical protein [archaeon]
MASVLDKMKKKLKDKAEKTVKRIESREKKGFTGLIKKKIDEKIAEKRGKKQESPRRRPQGSAPDEEPVLDKDYQAPARPVSTKQERVERALRTAKGFKEEMKRHSEKAGIFDQPAPMPREAAPSTSRVLMSDKSFKKFKQELKDKMMAGGFLKSGTSTTCGKCGARNKPGATFCSECGNSLSSITATSYCGGCGARNRAGASYCHKCGGAL